MWLGKERTDGYDDYVHNEYDDYDQADYVDYERVKAPLLEVHDESSLVGTVDAEHAGVMDYFDENWLVYGSL